MHLRIARRCITFTNSIVVYNDARKHKNMSGRRQEMRRLIRSRAATCHVRAISFNRAGPTIFWRILSSHKEDDLLIQINAFNEITWKLVMRLPFLCVRRHFLVVSFDLFVDQ